MSAVRLPSPLSNGLLIRTGHHAGIEMTHGPSHGLLACGKLAVEDRTMVDLPRGTTAEDANAGRNQRRIASDSASRVERS